ncbi:MAG: LON peptidase substrate-binding domain-containing protein [Leptospirales bacterium]|jgi:Lon protease-like protein
MLILTGMAAPNLLPLFPLGSVLFPGVPIQLHIFEDRYKTMMQHCLDQNQEFGVVLIEEGREALGPIARTHSHGTCAQILKVQPLPEGRMNLVAIGTRRFRIVSLDREGADYLQGEVHFEEEAEATEAENRQAAGLLPLIQEYVDLVTSSESEEAAAAMDYSKLPRDARELSYAASYLLHVPQHQKQQLLELSTLPDLMAGVREIYRKQIELLKIVQERGLEPPDTAGGLSLN